MRRLGIALLVVSIVCAAIGAPLAAGAGQLPKLKQPGQITAHASTGRPTAAQARYTVEWVTGLHLRDTTVTEALCIVVDGHSPETDGLHLTADAARELADELDTEAAGPAVDVDNHRAHKVNVWERFTGSDAATLAERVTAAAEGH